jgi:hypothetical protein
MKCKSYICTNEVEKEIKAWGRIIHPVYCKSCRKMHTEDKNRVFTYKSCSHGVENINPGGYCNVCGNGRDFS